MIQPTTIGILLRCSSMLFLLIRISVGSSETKSENRQVTDAKPSRENPSKPYMVLVDVAFPNFRNGVALPKESSLPLVLALIGGIVTTNKLQLTTEEVKHDPPDGMELLELLQRVLMSKPTKVQNEAAEDYWTYVQEDCRNAIEKYYSWSENNAFRVRTEFYAVSLFKSLTEFSELETQKQVQVLNLFAKGLTPQEMMRIIKTLDDNPIFYPVPNGIYTRLNSKINEELPSSTEGVGNSPGVYANICYYGRKFVEFIRGGNTETEKEKPVPENAVPPLGATGELEQCLADKYDFSKDPYNIKPTLDLLEIVISTKPQTLASPTLPAASKNNEVKAGHLKETISPPSFNDILTAITEVAIAKNREQEMEKQIRIFGTKVLVDFVAELRCVDSARLLEKGPVPPLETLHRELQFLRLPHLMKMVFNLFVHFCNEQRNTDMVKDLREAGWDMIYKRLENVPTYEAPIRAIESTWEEQRPEPPHGAKQDPEIELLMGHVVRVATVPIKISRSLQDSRFDFLAF